MNLGDCTKDLSLSIHRHFQVCAGITHIMTSHRMSTLKKVGLRESVYAGKSRGSTGGGPSLLVPGGAVSTNHPKSPSGVTSPDGSLRQGAWVHACATLRSNGAIGKRRATRTISGHGKTQAPVKAKVYLALTAVFGFILLVVRVIYPHYPGMIVWSGLLTILFRYLTKRARWKWQAEDSSD